MGFLQNAFQNHVREEHQNEMEKLVSSATQDGSLSSAEKSSLYSRGATWYFSESDINAMIERSLKEHKNYFLRFTLPSLIKTACRDTVVSAQERSSLCNKAAVWDIPEQEVDVLIEQGISKRLQELQDAQAIKENLADVTNVIGSGVTSIFRGIGGLANNVIGRKKPESTTSDARRALNRLIEDALVDGEISAKEKRTLCDKAYEIGINDDEFEIMLNRKITEWKEEHKFTMPQMSTMPPMPTSNTTYMLAINGVQNGPFSIDQLKSMIPTQQFTQQTLVWTNGMPNWIAAAQVPELNMLFAPQMPPIPQV